MLIALRLGGNILILESAYSNNARHPISPKELRQGVKEFVNVDFFSPHPLSSKSERASSGITRETNRWENGGYPVLETRGNIAGANMGSAGSAVSAVHET
jgi:hypothetical protein